MNRRSFTRNCAAATLAATVTTYTPLLSAEGMPVAREAATSDAPFKISVMLWTIFRDLPFEERLEKVAEAGYRNVELVGEYQKWSEADYARANAKRKELGISFDATAGLKHGVANPADRDALLADQQGWPRRASIPPSH